MLSVLLEIMGVPKDKAIGVGDANNDVHLFKAVGLKVAMGNATDELKSQADIIVDSVENDGLAKFIIGMLEDTTK
jgi:hydroxymethylpyrimidine pyrophosphatase-like HAD family hydrolase